MRGADFGADALVRGFIASLVLMLLLLLALLAVSACWLFGIGPQPWMAGAAGWILLGGAAAVILGRIFRGDW